MRRSRSALTLVATCALVLPASAVAAPPWGTPRPVDQSSNRSAFSPGLAFAGEDGIVSFVTSRSIVADPSRPAAAVRGRLARLTDTRLGKARNVAGITETSSPQAYGATRTLQATRTRTGGKGFDRRYRVGVAFGRTDDTLAESTDTLARDVRLANEAPPVLAANRKGDAIVAWVAFSRGGSGRILISERRRGGSFGKPTVIVGSGYVDVASLAVAISGAGDVVIAFARSKDGGERHVEARVRRHGHSIGPVQELGPNRGLARIDAAIGRAGRTLVAWQTYDAGEEINGPTNTYGAVRAAGPHGFREAAALDAGGPRGGVGASITVAAAPDGSGTVAWSARTTPGFGDPKLKVRYATVGFDGRFDPTRELPGASGAVRDMAVANDGTTALAYSLSVPDGSANGALMVALHPPLGKASGTTFGTSELVSSADDRTEAAALAFPPEGKEPTAAWSSRAGSFRRVVRVSRRG